VGVQFEWRAEGEGMGPKPGAVILTAFPSAGLAATVAAHYMVQALQLPRIAVLDSEDAAPIALVQGGEVNPPIRAYGRDELAIVMSEFPAAPGAARAIANSVLDAAELYSAKLVLGIEGVVPHPTTAEPEEDPPDSEENVWAVSSRPSPEYRELFLKKAKAKPLTDGVLGGISGALLLGGQTRKVPVAVLLVSTRAIEGMPDHRAAAALIETIDRLFPEIKIDTGPLRTQAELIERALRAAMKQPRSADHSAGNLPGSDLQTIYQ
jgi:uncharacterized protein